MAILKISDLGERRLGEYYSMDDDEYSISPSMSDRQKAIRSRTIKDFGVLQNEKIKHFNNRLLRKNGTTTC